MTILDDLNKRDEEAKKLLVDELDWCSSKIEEFEKYKNRLLAEMRKRGFIYDGKMTPQPISSSDTKPPLTDVILDILADGIWKSAQEIFECISKTRKITTRQNVGRRLHEMQLASKISTMPSDRENARPGTYLYSCIRPSPVTSVVVSNNVMPLPIEGRDYPVGKLITRLMSDGQKRTRTEIFAYVARFNAKTNIEAVGNRLLPLGLLSEIEERPTGKIRVYHFPIARTTTVSGT